MNIYVVENLLISSFDFSFFCLLFIVYPVLISVGSAPDGLYFSRDCKTLLVANEGELGEDDNEKLTDPEGSVSIIKFTSADLSGPYTNTEVNFTSFNSRCS